MNTIFIDVKNYKRKQDGSANKKNILYNKNFFKYVVKKDVLNNNFGKKMYIEFDVNYLNKMCIKDKFSLKYKFLKHLIEKDFSKDDTVYLVFSNFFDEHTILKDYILKLLKQNSLTIYDEIIKTNEMKNHDMIYVEEYLNKGKIKLNKLRILFVLDNINDYDDSKVIEYISKYKFLDILRCSNISKSDSKRLYERIKEINNEYGSTIEIIQKRNISMYHIYVIFSKISKENFIENYILKRNSMYIDLKDADEDILSSANIAFDRYRPDIEVMFNRLNIIIGNFSINKLGNFLIKNNI